MTTTKTSNTTGLIGGLLIVAATVAGIIYLVMFSTAALKQEVASELYPTQVLDTAFGSNGPFVKTAALGSPNNASNQTNIDVNTGEIGKVNITSFE